MSADKDSFLEHFQGKILVIRIKNTIKAKQFSPASYSFSSLFNLLIADLGKWLFLLLLYQQYLEDSDEITGPPHSVQAGHNIGTSLGEDARECKVLCSWVAFLSSGLCCFTRIPFFYCIIHIGVVWWFFQAVMHTLAHYLLHWDQTFPLLPPSSSTSHSSFSSSPQLFPYLLSLLLNFDPVLLYAFQMASKTLPILHLLEAACSV